MADKIIDRTGNLIVFPSDVSTGVNVDVDGNVYNFKSLSSGFVYDLESGLTFKASIQEGPLGLISSLGGEVITPADITASSSGTRESMFPNTPDRAANGVDSSEIDGVSFIGIGGSAAQLAEPNLSSWFDFGAGLVTDEGSGVYRVDIDASGGDKQIVDNFTTVISEPQTSGFEIELVSGDPSNLKYQMIRTDTFAVTSELPLDDITAGYEVKILTETSAHTQTRIRFFVPNGGGTVSFRVKKFRSTATKKLMPFSTGAYTLDDLECTPTFGSTGTLFVVELPYYWSRNENPFNGQYAFYTANLFSAQSAQNINLLGSGFSPNINTGGRLLENKLSTFAADWNGTEIGVRFGKADRLSAAETDTPTGTLQLGNQANLSSPANARFAFVVFPTVLTQQQNDDLYDAFLSATTGLTSDKITLACYGDSMTAGVGATTGVGEWPTQIEDTYGVFVSNNEGISGQTPQQFTGRYIADRWCYDYDYLILWEAGDNGGTISEQIGFFNSAITNANGNYIVIGRCTTGDETANNAALLAEYGAENFLDIKTILVTESGQPNYDIYRSDSIHLNDAGYAIVAREVARLIDPALITDES